MNKFNRYFSRLSARQFELGIIVFLAFVFFTTLLASHAIRPYNSDDVTTQTVVQSWEQGRPRDAIVGEDTYTIKMPFFVLHDAVEQNSRVKLFISVLVFNSVLFAGLIFFMRSIISAVQSRSKMKLALAYLPVGWWLALTAVPYAGNRNVLFMNPDIRNAELGIALFLLGFLLRHIRKNKLWRNNTGRNKYWIGLLLLLGGVSLLFESDPYFSYILGLPVIILALYLAMTDRISWKRAVGLVGYTGAAIVGSTIVTHIVKLLGLDSFKYVAKQFITLDQLPASLANTVWSELNQFCADISGQVINPHLLPQLTNLLLLTLTIIALCATIASRKQKRLEPSAVLLLLLAGVNVLIFSIDVINNFANNRFLVMAVVAQVLLLSLYGLNQVSDRKWQVLLVALYCLGIAVNLGSNLHAIGYHVIGHQPSPNAHNYAVIDAVKKEGLTKGYAPYWDSLINTYFADSKIHFLPTNCKYDQLHKLDWVVNKSDFDIPATKTFYLYTTDSGGCPIPGPDARPAKVIPIDPTTTLYIFNYDIGRAAPSTTL